MSQEIIVPADEESRGLLIDELTANLQKWHLAIYAASPGLLEKLGFDQWGLQDMLAHLSGWNILTIDTLRDIRLGVPNIYWLPDEDIDQFNDTSVNARRGDSLDEVYTEFVTTSQALIDAYRKFPDEYWEVSFGPEENSTPARGLAIDVVHFNEHYQEVFRALVTG